MMKFTALFLLPVSVNGAMYRHSLDYTGGITIQHQHSLDTNGGVPASSNFKGAMNRRGLMVAECPISHPYADASGIRCCEFTPIGGACEEGHWIACPKSLCESANEVKLFADRIRKACTNASSLAPWDKMKRTLQCKCEEAPDSKCMRLLTQRNGLRCVLDDDSASVYFHLHHRCNNYNLRRAQADMSLCNHEKEVPYFGRPCKLVEIPILNEDNDVEEIRQRCLVRPLVEIVMKEGKNVAPRIRFTGRNVGDKFSVHPNNKFL